MTIIIVAVVVLVILPIMWGVHLGHKEEAERERLNR